MDSPTWPVLTPSAPQPGKVVVRGVFSGNPDWETRKPYDSLYSALLGTHGARALAREAPAIRAVLKNNGKFLLLAVSLSGDDRLIVTDGREAVLVSRRDSGVASWDNVSGALARKLFQHGTVRQPLESLGLSGRLNTTVASAGQGADSTPVLRLRHVAKG